MTTVFVWVLITCGGYNGGTCSYSAPHTTQAACEYTRAQLDGRGKCAAMTIAKGSLQ